MHIKKFYCSVCRTRYDAPGFCSQCPNEPLLDLMDPQVHEWLFEMDRKRKFQRSYKIALSLAASFVGLCHLMGPSQVTDSIVILSIVKILAFAPLNAIWHLYRNPPKLLYPDLSPEDLEFFGTKIPLALNTPVDAETRAMIDEITLWSG